MGVSGTGKTTIGKALAEQLGAVLVEVTIPTRRPTSTRWPPASRSTTTTGGPGWRLWRGASGSWTRRARGRSPAAPPCCRSTATGCARAGTYFFLHLHTDYDILLDRMSKPEHFMPPSLLQSQFDTLEMLEPDEAGALVGVRVGIEEVTGASMSALRAPFSG